MIKVPKGYEYLTPILEETSQFLTKSSVRTYAMSLMKEGRIEAMKALIGEMKMKGHLETMDRLVTDERVSQDARHGIAILQAVLQYLAENGSRFFSDDSNVPKKTQIKYNWRVLPKELLPLVPLVQLFGDADDSKRGELSNRLEDDADLLAKARTFKARYSPEIRAIFKEWERSHPMVSTPEAAKFVYAELFLEETDI